MRRCCSEMDSMCMGLARMQLSQADYMAGCETHLSCIQS